MKLFFFSAIFYIANAAMIDDRIEHGIDKMNRRRYMQQRRISKTKDDETIDEAIDEDRLYYKIMKADGIYSSSGKSGDSNYMKNDNKSSSGKSAKAKSGKQSKKSKRAKTHKPTTPTTSPNQSPRSRGNTISINVEDGAIGIFGGRSPIDREFTVYEPQVTTTTKQPVVIFFHGVSGSSEDIARVTRFDEEADKRGWLTVYPQGNRPLALLRISNWNGAGCCARRQDDMLFIKDMIDYMVDNFNADEEKVFVAGFSNGAFMVYKLLCEMGNRDNGRPWIRAAAAHAGLLGIWQNEEDFSSCQPSSSVPLLHLHGLADPVVNVNGKQRGDAAFPDLAAEIQFTIRDSEWKSANDSVDFVADAICGSTAVTGSSEPKENTLCNEMCDGSVKYCLIEGLEHKYPGASCDLCGGCTDNNICDPDSENNIDATEYITDFFVEMSSQ